MHESGLIDRGFGGLAPMRNSIWLYREFKSPMFPIGVACGGKAWCVAFFNRSVNVLTAFTAK